MVLMIKPLRATHPRSLARVRSYSTQFAADILNAACPSPLYMSGFASTTRVRGLSHRITPPRRQRQDTK